ncbi:MAG TPA: hypothetical protein VEL11_11115 [Candidatus Bathyarchaeia archaeon]|nr:hypothetical protein [Candidatus Bathyarchaeia archaeon]
MHSRDKSTHYDELLLFSSHHQKIIYDIDSDEPFKVKKGVKSGVGYPVAVATSRKKVG